VVQATTVRVDSTLTRMRNFLTFGLPLLGPAGAACARAAQDMVKNTRHPCPGRVRATSRQLSHSGGGGMRHTGWGRLITRRQPPDRPSPHQAAFWRWRPGCAGVAARNLQEYSTACGWPSRSCSSYSSTPSSGPRCALSESGARARNVPCLSGPPTQDQSSPPPETKCRAGALSHRCAPSLRPSSPSWGRSFSSCLSSTARPPGGIRSMLRPAFSRHCSTLPESDSGPTDIAGPAIRG
jgi:hypothetical protein